MNAFVKTEIWSGIFNKLLFCAVNVTRRIYGHGFDRNAQESRVDQNASCGIEFRDKSALGSCILVKDGLRAGVAVKGSRGCGIVRRASGAAYIHVTLRVYPNVGNGGICGESRAAVNIVPGCPAQVG